MSATTLLSKLKQLSSNGLPIYSFINSSQPNQVSGSIAPRNIIIEASLISVSSLCNDLYARGNYT